MSEQKNEFLITEASWAKLYMLQGRVIDVMIMNMMNQPNNPKTNPIFNQKWLGDYRRTASFYNAGSMLPQGIERYSDKESTPPVARLLDTVHAELRKGTARLPMLDETALQSETITAMRQFRNIIKRYGDAVKATPERHYESIPQVERDNYDREIRVAIKALNASELRTASTVPVEMISSEGVTTTEHVPNAAELGIYLFALSFVPRMQVDLNRVPVEAREFLRIKAGTTMETLLYEVDRFDKWAPDELKAGVQQVFERTNQSIEEAFHDQQRTLQITHLIQPQFWQKPLELMGLPRYPKTLETPLEAAIVIESFEEWYNKRALEPLARSFAALKDESLPLDLIKQTKRNLSRLSPRHDRCAAHKIDLLRDYLDREQDKMLPSTWSSLPGRSSGRGRW